MLVTGLTADEIAEALRKPAQGLFDVLSETSYRRPKVFVGTPVECPKGERLNADWNCHKRLIDGGRMCAGRHGYVYAGPFEGIWVEVN